ncbi:MAG: hypothetical protein Kow0031_00330 [Anaerolineae bacterium]
MLTQLSMTRVVNPRPGWYRGEFHAHTNFSDGVHPPPELAELARAAGLDFFAITDHNTVEAFPHFGDTPNLLIIPGIEITMKEGHYNVFGLDGQFDWLPAVCSWPNELSGPMGSYQNASQLMAHAAGQGLLNSINHPLLPPWDWLDFTTDLRHLHCLEIFNDPTYADNDWANPKAVDMWSRWLNAGYRVTAIGGTDYHQPQLARGYNTPQRMGLAGTFVYARELSGAAILEGLRRRQVYVSLGPQLTFEAACNGEIHAIGADLGRVDGQISFTATVQHSAPVEARLVKNGDTLAVAQLADDTPWQHTEPVDAAQPAWFRLDLFDAGQRRLAVTNPIFTGPPVAPSPPHSYGAFVENAPN